MTRRIEARVQDGIVSAYRGKWGYPRIAQPDEKSDRWLLVACVLAVAVAYVAMAVCQ